MVRTARRLATAVLVIWLVHLLTFLLIRLVPGDPAQQLAGERATAEEVALIRTALGLDDPLPVQYGRSLGALVRGDLGQSIFNGLPVVRMLADAAPATLSVALVALLFASLFGVGAGVVAGLRQGGWADRAVSTVATVGIALPSFWIGMVLVTFFALVNPWFPATGYAPLSEGGATWLRHLVLPGTTLGLAVAAEIARHTRGGVIDVLAKPYIRTARARGATGVRLVRGHVLRNAAIPVVTVLGLQTGKLLGGTVIVEAVFGISGLGSLAVNSALERDYPVLQGFVIFAAVVVVTANLLVDVAYGRINPKVNARVRSS
ncbi:ABC transporter permease [Nonomuraea lactucae]|uniref:ABC transporter permease n=1 Tax=Nonomuraea lactucae TaxID=2249762 RepID=UPI000DE3E0E9|nr:ABC transporter permease [Nonomuraea lactucae]